VEGVLKFIITSLPIFCCLFVQKQDHYAVLGLSHLRYNATAEQIKIARSFNAFIMLLVLW